MKRVACIDYLKAFGIVCVVFGHSQIPDPLLVWIYSFHMPLFFFASGFLLSRESLDQSFKGFFRRKLLKLICAYVIFAAVGSAVAIAISQFGDPRFRTPLAETVIYRVLSIFYASGSIEGKLTLMPAVLWFFSALIMSFVFVYVAVHYIPRWFRGLDGFLTSAALIFFTLLAFLLNGHHFPWQIESGLAAALIVYAGHVCRMRDVLSTCAAIPVIVAIPCLGGGLVFGTLEHPAKIHGFKFRQSAAVVFFIYSHDCRAGYTVLQNAEQ
jgi:fucose 4-O-acetylase-like acetyltransferase